MEKKKKVKAIKSIKRPIAPDEKGKTGESTRRNKSRDQKLEKKTKINR